MPYCQNCGAEIIGNFCPNCGAQAGGQTSPVRGPIIHENADVKPRYSTGAMVLAGYLGFVLLMSALLSLICFIYAFSIEFNIGLFLVTLVIIAFVLGLAFLCYLPGIRSIRKRSPEGTAMKTFWSFFRKSLAFILAWGISMIGCVYIFGLFFKVWRLGMWASRPNVDEYTAFVDGKKIGVIRYIDNTPYGDGKTRYIYQDANGEFYRPAIR